MNSPLSGRVSTAAATAGSVKLGQPVPDSNLVSEENSAAPQPAQWYIPSSFEWAYAPLNGGSVPFWRSTSYCAGVSRSRHSSSEIETSGLSDIGRTLRTIDAPMEGNGRRPHLTHMPALDGLRGVAVAGVLAFHLGRLTGGYLGVDAFFVLSGFLITSLLLAE